MSGYVKMFSSILESTVWQEPLHVRVVWVSMLAMANRDGVIEASIPGLAKRAGVSRKQAEESIDVFLAPDPDSRTSDHEGRRIEKVDGGWVLLNHEKYREKESPDEQRAKAAARQQRKRDKEKAKKSESVAESHAPSRDVTPSHAGSREVTPSEADAESEADPFQRETAREPGPSTPSRVHLDEFARRTYVRACEKRRITPSREHKNFAADVWRELHRFGHDTSAITKEDPQAVIKLTIRGFLESEAMRLKGFPVSFLANNPLEFLTAGRAS